MVNYYVARGHSPIGLVPLEKVGELMVLNNLSLHKVGKMLSFLVRPKSNLDYSNQGVLIYDLDRTVLSTVVFEYLSENLHKVLLLHVI